VVYRILDNRFQSMNFMTSGNSLVYNRLKILFEKTNFMGSGESFLEIPIYIGYNSFTASSNK